MCCLRLVGTLSPRVVGGEGRLLLVRSAEGLRLPLIRQPSAQISYNPGGILAHCLLFLAYQRVLGLHLQV